MTVYFDATTGSAQLLLLPPAIRGDARLPVIASEAEALTIAAFTVSTYKQRNVRPDIFVGSLVIADNLGDATQLDAYTYVCLRGYMVDASLATDPLLSAMRREIAGVIRWGISRWSKEPNLRTDGASDGSKIRTFRDDAEDARPPGFGAWLAPFDIRPPVFAI